MSTSGADVLQILAELSGAGVLARLVGGCGVDALVGRQTREHRDLDLVVAAQQLDRALAALSRPAWSPPWPLLTARHQIGFHSGHAPREVDLDHLALLEHIRCSTVGQQPSSQ